MNIKKVLAAGAGILVTSVSGAASVSAVNCPTNSIRTTANSLAECNLVADNSLMPTVGTIIDVILGVLGIVAVAVIILGGVQYTTSTGDPAKIKKAKDTILYGVVGLVVALLAYAIVNFILSSVF